MKKVTSPEKKIYQQTQQLAMRFAKLDGWDAPLKVFSGKSKDIRGSGYFRMAVLAQEFLCGHEMSDLLEEMEG